MTQKIKNTHIITADFFSLFNFISFPRAAATSSAFGARDGFI
jgi:hypothetical protein